MDWRASDIITPLTRVAFVYKAVTLNRQISTNYRYTRNIYSTGNFVLLSTPIVHIVPLVKQLVTHCLSSTTGQFWQHCYINKPCGRPPQYAPPPASWPFDLESGVWVMSDMGYLCANFILPRPLSSQLRPDVRDRQMSDTHHHLMPLPRDGGMIIALA